MPQRTDDLTVADDALLWRRILDPRWVNKEEDGSYRPTSAAFRDGLTGEISVHLAEQIEVETVMKGYEDTCALVAWASGTSPADWARRFIASFLEET